MSRALIALLFVLSVTLVACENGDDASEPDGSPTEGDASAEQPDGEDAPGQASDELTLQVGEPQAASSVPGPQGDILTADNGVLVVFNAVANNGTDEPVDLQRSDFVVAGSGEEYEPHIFISNTSLQDDPEALAVESVTVEAGASAQLGIGFDVPGDAGAMTLSMPDGQEVEIGEELLANVPPSTPVEDLQQWDEPEQVIDAEANDYRATVVTEQGDLVIDLFDDQAPNTVNNFVFLAQEGFFDGIAFHRVVEDFVAQTGDPTGTSAGGPGYTVEEEPNELTNDRGTVAMAKAEGSAAFGSQWFINLADNAPLNEEQNRFYPFGEVVEGMDLLDSLAQGDRIESVEIEETPGE